MRRRRHFGPNRRVFRAVNRQSIAMFCRFLSPYSNIRHKRQNRRRAKSKTIIVVISRARTHTDRKQQMLAVAPLSSAGRIEVERRRNALWIGGIELEAASDIIENINLQTRNAR